MSGFEIAGVILGSLPIIVKALEYYSEGLSTIKSMTQYEKGFRDLHAVFELAWTLYTTACERLLLPLAISHHDYNELIHNPMSDKWRDQTLHQKLKIRLGRAYEPYKIGTEVLHKKVEKLRKKLKLNEHGLPPWVILDGDSRVVVEIERARFFKNKWTRMKGGFDLKGCALHVDRIRRDIEDIANIVRDASELEGPRKKRQQQYDSKHWLTIRDHARRLFNSLDTRWSAPCLCQHSHCASIQLDRRDEEWNCSQDLICFRLVMSFEQSAPTAASPPWSWRGIEIAPRCIVTIPTVQTAAVPSVQFSSAPYIVGASTPASISNTNTTATVSITQAVTQHFSPASKIDDLCHTLKGAQTLGRSLGYLEDSQWQHHIYQSSLDNCSHSTRQLNSLQEILGRRNVRDLSTKEKRALSLKMALAVLQLHDTPWLDPSFHVNDLIFLTDNLLDSASLFQPAYLSRTFNSSSISPNYASVALRGRKLTRNALIFALGVALMEISYGKTLVDQAQASELDDQGNETPQTEMLVAARLVEDIRNRELDNYAWATASCVRCDMGYPFDYSLDDDGFRSMFIERVIGPLKADYDEIFFKR